MAKNTNVEGASTNLIVNFEQEEQITPEIPKYEVINHEKIDYSTTQYESENNRLSIPQIKEIIKLKGMGHLETKWSKLI